MQSSDYLSVAGFDVIVKNYVIFSHLLWRLFSKDWIELEFIIESFLNLWYFFWGGKGSTGYFCQMDENERNLAIDLVLKQHNDATILAGLFYSDLVCVRENQGDLRGKLRDFFRQFLNYSPLSFNKQTVEDLWLLVGSMFPYDAPLPETIIKNLLNLALHTSQPDFLNSLEVDYGLSEGSCSIDTKQSVFRSHLGRSAPVDSLIIGDTRGIPDLDTAISMANDLAAYHPKDYYRIRTTDNNRLFFFDQIAKSGLYWQKDTGDEITFSDLPIRKKKKWEMILDRLLAYASDVSEEISISLSRVQIKRSG